MDIKSIVIVQNMYKIIKKNLIKISPELAIKLIYRISFKKKINLDAPKTFSEKLMWLNLYWNDDLKIKCTDKYNVREYVSKNLKSNILNDLYNVYNSVNEIDWSKLPDSFVLKCTHGSGTNIICKSKEKLNKEEAKKSLSKWMKTDYSLYSAELHYNKIKPRIICEKFIKSKNGELPIDYKIYCFNGEPKITLVCEERESGKTKLSYYNNEWERLYLESGEKNLINSERPKNHNEMLEIARKLAKGIPFVRVDLYDFEGRVLFGEMTFTPRGCLNTNISEEAQIMLGNLIDINCINKKQISNYL